MKLNRKHINFSFYLFIYFFTLIVNELSIVSSTVLIFTWRISRASSSSAEIILTTWPGMGCDTVFRSRLGPENFTSTSATADFELATNSLKASLMEEEVEELHGEGGTGLGREGELRKFQGLYGLLGWGVLGLIGRLNLGLNGGFRGLSGEGLGLETSLGLKTSV